MASEAGGPHKPRRHGGVWAWERKGWEVTMRSFHVEFSFPRMTSRDFDGMCLGRGTYLSKEF